MKRLLFLAFVLFSWLLVPSFTYADETVTVTATNVDISENLDLRMVATLFGQAKDLEEFEQMLNNPDSAYSNLDLNGDGEVDYLRVVETANDNRHLVVIQAVLAKDIYQDVASIFVEKDPDSEAVTVQVIGDEYIYGANYVIEPVYIYRPYIYDWFWGPSWVCWHSPYYWGYWPGWWHSYHSIAHHLYWEHMYWHHHYHPICSYRTAHHYHPHYAPMRQTVSRTDYATRHPERSFVTRNASRQMTNARDIDRTRHTAVREAMKTSRTPATGTVQTRISQNNPTRNATYGSSNVRPAATAVRNAATRVNGNTTRTMNNAVTRTTSGTTTVRSNAATSRSNTVSTATRNSVSTATRNIATSPSRLGITTATRPTSSSATRSVNTSSAVRSSSSASSVRSANTGASMRSSGSISSGSSSMRSSGGNASRSSGGNRR